MALAVVILQTQWAKTQLAGLIEQQLSDENTQASVAGIRGLIPLDMQVDRFALADDQGVWLEIEEAEFDLAIGKLFTSAVRLQAVGAKQITLNRIPRSTAPPEPPSDEPFALPEIPQLPETLPDLAIRRLFVERLILGEPILGQPLELSLDGHVETSDEGDALAAELSLNGLGGADLGANLTAGLGLGDQALDLNLSVHERSGLIANIAQMPELGDLSLDWQGQGPLRDWQSELSLQAAGLLSAEFGVDLGLIETPFVAIDGSITPDGDVLPAEIAGLLTSPVGVSIALKQRAPGNFELNPLAINSDPVRIIGEAVVDQQAGQLQADINLTAGDLSRFSALTGIDLGGAFELRVQGETTDPGPLISLTLETTELVADTNAIDKIAGAFEFAFTEPLDQGFVGANAVGSLSADGISADGQAMFAEQSVALDLDAILLLEGESVVRQLTLDTGAGKIDVNGTLVLEDGAGDITIQGNVPSLEQLLKAVNVESEGLNGSVELVTEIALDDQFQSIIADLVLESGDLAGLPGEAVQLTGTSPRASLKADVGLGEQARIYDINVTTQAGQLSGEITAELDEAGQLSGQINATLPKLADLESLLQQPISGSADLSLALSGTMKAPAVDLQAKVAKLATAGQSVDLLTLNVNGDKLIDAPQGSMSLTLEQPQGTLSLATDYQLSNDQLLLNGLALQGPATDLAGNLSADLGGPLINGALKGGISDLAALQPWHGQDLTGSVDLDVQLNHQAGQQAVMARLGVPNLRGEFGELTALDLRADLSDALKTPAIDAELTFGIFEQPNLRVRDTAIAAKGTLADLAITLQTMGEQGAEPFSLQLAANADVAEAAKTVILERLEGRAAGQDIKLQRPATIVQDGEIVDIDRIDLVIGEASIEGGLEMGGGRIDGRLELKSLPLAMLASLGGPDFAGNASGFATIQGSVSAPQIELAIDTQSLRPNDPAYKAADGLSLELNATVASGQAKANIEIGNLADDPAVISVALPMQLAIEPFAFDLDERAPLDGDIQGTIDLSRITRLLQLDGQIVEGLLRADLAIGGRLDQPQILGEALLSDGLVEDSVSGLSLKFLRGRVIAERDEIRIEGLEARDGDGGKIAVNGGVDIRSGGSFPYQLTVTSDDMRVLSNEIGRVYVDTDVDISGDTNAGSVTGKVIVPRAEIAIPGGGGVDPVALDVKNVGANKPVETSQPAAVEPAGPGYVLDLDLAIELPSETFVRGRGLDTEWGGALEVSGTSQAPVVTGAIAYRRGFLDFLDRRFDITQGTISFTGASPPIPEIDLRAEAQGPTLLAVVTIAGPATDPELELSSEPSRPNDEILSDLLFNRDVSAITPVQAIRLANAVRTLEGGGLDTMGQLRNAIGVDTLDIGGDSAEEASAKVGKYVADGVFLELEQGLTSGKSTARVEVELTDTISFNTEVDNESQAGVGLEWSLDY